MPTERRKTAWETGGITPAGWEDGEVEEEVVYPNEGSQTPPARDRDGRFLDDPEMAVYPYQRVAARYKAAREWAPEQRLLDALNSTDKAISQMGWLWREFPQAKPIIEKAQHSLEVASQIMGRDLAREMHLPSSRVASRRMSRTAGEVRFIKDRGGDKNEWGWGAPGPSKRELDPAFKFKPGKVKPLAMTLRASLMALGHALSAFQTFTKLKSATVSPDGALGGRGYIQKIAEMRRQYMNVAEALSAITDTLYDEIHAPHWDPATEGQDPRERKQVKEIMQDVEEIRGDPEGWAEEEELEMDAGDKGKKTARRLAKQAAQSEYVTDLSQFQIQRVTRAHLKKVRGL